MFHECAHVFFLVYNLDNGINQHYNTLHFCSLPVDYFFCVCVCLFVPGLYRAYHAARRTSVGGVKADHTSQVMGATDTKCLFDHGNCHRYLY